ncbi:MAG: hypothetical protein AAFP90_09955, partial [Planctomycetota bacterium]
MTRRTGHTIGRNPKTKRDRRCGGFRKTQVCGGRIAEQRHTSDISSGASMDIRMATDFSRAMVLEWGMS